MNSETIMFNIFIIVVCGIPYIMCRNYINNINSDECGCIMAYIIQNFFTAFYIILFTFSNQIVHNEHNGMDLIICMTLTIALIIFRLDYIKSRLGCKTKKEDTPSNSSKSSSSTTNASSKGSSSITISSSNSSKSNSSSTTSSSSNSYSSLYNPNEVSYSSPPPVVQGADYVYVDQSKMDKFVHLIQTGKIDNTIPRRYVKRQCLKLPKVPNACGQHQAEYLSDPTNKHREAVEDLCHYIDRQDNNKGW